MPGRVLAPFARAYTADLDTALTHARADGAETVRDVADQATGRNATVRLRGGVVAELVEWDAATRARCGL